MPFANAKEHSDLDSARQERPATNNHASKTSNVTFGIFARGGRSFSANVPIFVWSLSAILKPTSMKIFLSIAALFIASFALAQPPDLPTTPGTVYGSDVKVAGALPVAELPRLLKENESQTVKIKGTVLDVCPKMGCWLSLEMPDKSTVFVKMKDYGFFVPTELKGKTVVMDAEAKVLKTSVEELRHYAEDARKSQQEIDAIKAPKEEIRLTASGITVVK